MIEKIRVSLWDVFTFFLTGLFAAAMLTAILIYLGKLSGENFLAVVKEMQTGVLLVAIPFLLTLVGMLIEPPANYLDKILFKSIVRKIFPEVRDEDEEILKKEIKEKYLGALNGVISNPYHICKDYVEYKQLSPTFMIFLARFGFYRNCAFIIFWSGVSLVIYSPDICHKLLSGLFSVAAVILYRKRAEDFYGYQAPAIYRAYIFDKIRVGDGK